jgi:hypothetical protein
VVLLTIGLVLDEHLLMKATSTQCTMANWIQATMYDDTSSQKAQITMSASSQSADFDCGTVLGAMNGLATGLDLAPPVVAATVFAQVVCAAASGS